MLVVLVTATIVTVLNNSMITVVLAAVGRDLSATPSALGWTATGIYFRSLPAMRWPAGSPTGSASAGCSRLD